MNIMQLIAAVVYYNPQSILVNFPIEVFADPRLLTAFCFARGSTVTG